MKINENQWKSMKINELGPLYFRRRTVPPLLMKSNERYMKSLKINVKQLKTIEKSVKINENQ